MDFFQLKNAQLPLALLAVAALAVGLAFIGFGSEDGSRPADAHYGQKRFPKIRSPLLGAYYTHYSFPGCTVGDATNTDILSKYNNGGVRAKVHRQLFRMRKRGLAALRILVWSMSNPVRQRWGVIPSAGGTLREPYRTNLISFLREVRKFGFARVSIGFSPEWTNNPRNPHFNRSKLEENWGMIRSVRPILKKYGPKDTRIDLFNEGGPSNHAPRDRFTRVWNYVREIYSRYVRAFGKSDVTVSAIAAYTPRDRGNRLGNLVNIFDSTGLGQPRSYELHLRVGAGEAEARYGLEQADLTLSRKGRREPLAITQTTYNDAGQARAIASFTRKTRRRVDEVLQWYSKTGTSCAVAPPYRATEFKKRLR